MALVKKYRENCINCCIVTVIIFLLQSEVVLGQITEREFSVTESSDDYVIKNWNITEGLPQSSPKVIYQTRDGYLWVGTWNGLARFDGLRFTSFHPGNTNAFTTGIISSLYQDRDGVLWIGTDGGGLVEYKSGVFTKRSNWDGEKVSVVSAFSEDEDGRLWMATNKGIFVRENDTFRKIYGEDNALNATIKNIIFDGSGDLWIDIINNLYRVIVKNDSLKVIDKIEILSGGIARDEDGRIWFFTPDRELVAAAGYVWEVSKQFNDDKITSLFSLRNGIGICFMDRIVLIRDTTATVVTDAGGIHLKINDSLFEDGEGNIWLGRASSGLFRLRKRTVTVYGRENGLTSELVTSIGEDSNGIIWVGTYRDGLNYYRDGKFYHFVKGNFNSNNDILSVAKVNENEIWIASRGNGIERIRNFELTRYEQGIIGNETTVRTIVQGKDQAIWIGTREDGVQVDKEGQITFWDTRSGLSSNEISFILPTQKAGTWVGTVAGGVNWIFNDSVVVINTENGLSSNEIQSMAEDSDGNIWMATRRGLNRWKNGEITKITEKDGLADDAIAMLLNDDQGYFWMGGIKGMSRISIKELNEVADGKNTVVQFNRFGVEDGMINPELGGQGMPNILKDNAGRIWFTSENGLKVINPKELPESNISPNVIIEQVAIENEPAQMDSIIVLKPGESKIEITYTGISFRSPMNVHFQYKMDGIDQDWINAGTRRTIQYTNLPPGEYKFYLKASNSDGLWSLNTASLGVVVTPALWQRTWFKLGMILLVIGGMVVFFQNRIHNLEKVQKLRLQIAGDLHDEIGSSLGTVILKTQLINKNKEDIKYLEKGLEEIRTITKNTSQAMRDIIWLINPSNDVMEDMVLQLKEITATILEGIEYSFVSDLEFSDLRVSPEIKRNMILILKEALHNIVKHAEATRVDLKLYRSDSDIVFVIKDHGKGFNKKVRGDHKHYGLKSMKDRAEKIKATLMISSEEGTGTTVMLRLKNYGGS